MCSWLSILNAALVTYHLDIVQANIDSGVALGVLFVFCFCMVSDSLRF